MSRITRLTGFPEWLPRERLIEQRFLDVLRETFELHGFSGIETRAVEPVDFLLRKGEIDKEVYGVRRIHADSSEKDAMALHYDMTVPFSRYVLENAGKLEFPFKRYQMQKAWRGERPQFGRFREFIQADADIVDRGELAGHFDAEIVSLIVDIFTRLDFGRATVRVSTRKIPEGFYRGLGIDDPAAVLRAVDKLDKIGPEKVRGILPEAVTDEQAEKILALAGIRTSDSGFAAQAAALGVHHELLDEGVRELAELMDAVAPSAGGEVVADLSIARGLDYYTGTVFETNLVGFEELGSVCSGGRYEKLASDGKATYPGVGLSVGVSRIMAVLVRDDIVTASRGVPTCVLVAVTDDAQRAESNEIARALRTRGIATEVSPSAARFGKQIKYADRRGIPFVWFTGSDGTHQIKDIRSGEQVDADPQTWTPSEDDRTPRLIRKESSQ
ncbi:histidine--tRNA ligase [Blastococcus sp. Marseille-P5729]|uniref:histidine--tRNA ligase n=1 Tax=Blastococcus sp. Marseille-P5729 TaxID=2086582 RepID=UPI000D106A19|nr:histidine--tRNA ligase [Blastococcus sp. Marseille-P5729]